MLFTFVSLWIMSIFGNYGDIVTWARAGYTELLGWCVVFAAASGVAILYGLKRGDRVSVGFGITFLLINIYTRFFEHFWTPLHKAFVFGLLAASFWFIGSKAESIWNLGREVGTSNKALRPPRPRARG